MGGEKERGQEGRERETTNGRGEARERDKYDLIIIRNDWVIKLQREILIYLYHS